ncbi:S41 family peptidase [Alphaproteobacteria bacterium]|nr:S41 family peptidase [Alphaproteobacteria bacterium]
MQIVSFLSTQGRRMRYAALPFICGAVIAGLAIPTLTIAQSGKNDAVYRQLGLFGDIFQRVRESYVDEVDDKDLVEAAINGMLTSLDPHSSFLNNDHFSDMQVQTKGKFGGLGIEITMEDGVIKIVSPIDDTPAAEAGLQPEDLIIAVNDEPIRGMTLSDAVDRLRGEVGSSVTVTIKRGAKDPFDVSLKRDTIKIRSVRAKMFDGIGYLRITTFSEQTTPGLTKEIDKMFREHGQELKGFVLDLRNNPGGLLNEAISVSDAFLEKGEIVSTRGRRAENASRAYARPGDIANGLPLVVLINSGSASASEIVAGALKDHRRAVLLGTRSFGKGSVQTVIPVSSNSAMRLTTARYYTPSGVSIQATGISPDIEVALARIETLDGGDTREEDLKGALDNGKDGKEGEPANAEKPDVTPAADQSKIDYQLARALDLIRGVSIFTDVKFGS